MDEKSHGITGADKGVFVLVGKTREAFDEELPSELSSRG